MGAGRGGLRPAPKQVQQGKTAKRNLGWLRPFLLVNGFLVCLATTVDKVEATGARWLSPLLACLAACASLATCASLVTCARFAFA